MTVSSTDLSIAAQRIRGVWDVERSSSRGFHIKYLSTEIQTLERGKSVRSRRLLRPWGFLARGSARVPRQSWSSWLFDPVFDPEGPRKASFYCMEDENV